MRNSTRVPFEIRYPERQLLCLSTESLVVKHGRDAARPVFSAPPTLCFHKSRPGGVPSRMGRCSCTHCHAPCTRARNSSFSTSAASLSSSFSNPALLRSLPPPVVSRPAPVSPLSAFLCGFAVFFRLVFFSPPVSPNGIPPAPLPFPARAFTFRLQGVITASCGLLAVCRWDLQVVPRGNRSR